MSSLLLLLILFLVQFIGFVVIVFGLLKHWIQLATAGTGTTGPWTTGTRLGKRIGILLGHGIVAVQIRRRSPGWKHVALLKRGRCGSGRGGDGSGRGRGRIGQC